MTKEISKEDLHWLYYGDENDQIISKLTNEENALEASVVVTEMSNEDTNTVDVLTFILSNLKEGKVIKQINEDQIKRLNILNEKYKFLEDYEKELQLIKDNKDQIREVICNIYKNGNYDKHILISSNRREFFKDCEKELKYRNLLIHRNKIKDLLREILTNL